METSASVIVATMRTKMASHAGEASSYKFVVLDHVCEAADEDLTLFIYTFYTHFVLTSMSMSPASIYAFVDLVKTHVNK